MKALVGSFNQEKALVGAFSVCRWFGCSSILRPCVCRDFCLLVAGLDWAGLGGVVQISAGDTELCKTLQHPGVETTACRPDLGWREPQHCSGWMVATLQWSHLTLQLWWKWHFAFKNSIDWIGYIGFTGDGRFVKKTSRKYNFPLKKNNLRHYFYFLPVWVSNILKF